MYQYSQERGRIFTDDGQRDFLKVRDHVKKLLSQAGAVRMQEQCESLAVTLGLHWLALIDLSNLKRFARLPQMLRRLGSIAFSRRLNESLFSGDL